MRIAFTADDGAFEADEFAIVCGVAGEGKWLTFQRTAEGVPDDWGIHLEYGGQANGSYDCITACRLTDRMLSVDLVDQLGRLAGVSGFDVTLVLRPNQLTAVRDGLQLVFRGQPDRIVFG